MDDEAFTKESSVDEELLLFRNRGLLLPRNRKLRHCDCECPKKEPSENVDDVWGSEVEPLPLLEADVLRMWGRACRSC